MSIIRDISTTVRLNDGAYLEPGTQGRTVPVEITSTGFSGFTGKLHSLVIWDRMLTEAEVTQDFKRNRLFW